MKHALPLAAVLAISLSASAAKADSWSDYNKLMSPYYRIDKAESASVTYNISSSVMDELLDKIPFLADDLEADLQRFTVSVRPDGEIKFQAPKVRVNVGSVEANSKLSHILQFTVDSLQHAIECMLESFVADKRDRFSNLVITPKGDETAISFDYKLENLPVHRIEATLSKDAIIEKDTSDAGVFEAAAKFMPLDGKLAISKSIWQRTAPGKTTKEDAVIGAAAMTGVALSGSDADRVREIIAKITGGTTDVKYQKVGKTYFPSKISASVNFSDRPEPRTLVISFTNCAGG